MAVKKESVEKENAVLLGVEKEKSTDVSKCPACGANLVFSPETQNLKCEHCRTEVGFATAGNEELNFEEMLTKGANTWADETHVFSCNNCGAKQILSKDDIAKECSFCGTTNIVETNELSGLKPNAVVPFKIGIGDAGVKARAWAKKKMYAPRKFKRNLSAEDISGTYNPAFTFDTDSISLYEGRLGRRVTYTVIENGRTVTKTRIDYFKVSGRYSLFFDDILIQASTTINQKTIDSLQPFYTNSSNKYKKEFLHGYTANQYTKDGMQCWGEARKIIDKRIRAGILAQYTYDVVDYLKIRTDCRNITYKYMLVPIYVGHFNFRAKLYNFFVNGFSGKVTGKYPLSILKITATVLLGLGLIAGIAALVILLG